MGSTVGSCSAAWYQLALLSGDSSKGWILLKIHSEEYDNHRFSKSEAVIGVIPREGSGELGLPEVWRTGILGGKVMSAICFVKAAVCRIQTCPALPCVFEGYMFCKPFRSTTNRTFTLCLSKVWSAVKSKEEA